MSFIFTMRNAPGNASSLPAISEDSGSFTSPRDPPPVPPRASNRPADRHFGLGFPPKFNHDRSPPPYADPIEDGPLDGESGEKLAGLRRGVANNKHIARRGGWKRLLVIGIIVALCIVGLVVGIVVGLRNRNKNSYVASMSILIPPNTNSIKAKVATETMLLAALQDPYKAVPPIQLQIPLSPQVPTLSTPTSQPSPPTAPPTPPPGAAIHTQHMLKTPPHQQQSSTGSSPPSKAPKPITPFPRPETSSPSPSPTRHYPYNQPGTTTSTITSRRRCRKPLCRLLNWEVKT